MVKMPSVSKWLWDENQYIEMAQEGCETTKTQRQSTMADYSKDSRRDTIHYLIHFPAGTKLDNAALGCDDQLKKDLVAMSHQVGTGRNWLPLNAMVVSWKIAEHGPRNLEAGEPATDVFAKFANMNIH